MRFLASLIEAVGIAVCLTLIWVLADFYMGKPPKDYFLLGTGIFMGAMSCLRWADVEKD